MHEREGAVRKAAQGLHDAIVAAREGGLVVEWPRHAGGLLSIAISEAGRGPAVTVALPAGTDPELASRASAAAQAAVEAVMAPTSAPAPALPAVIDAPLEAPDEVAH